METDGYAQIMKLVEPATAWVGTNVVYGRTLEERQNHPWLKKTLNSMMPKLRQTIDRFASKGMKACIRAAAIELVNELKIVLSVPAPRIIVTRREVLTGKKVRRYIATTPATRGAPPRKLSSRLRTSVTYEIRGG